MNYRSTPLQSATSAPKSFVRNTYRLPFPQPLYNQHLQTPLASIHSKGVITPAESILTDIGPCNLFRINTYEKQGGGGTPCQNFPLLWKRFRIDAGHELHGILVVDLFQDFVVELEPVNAPEGVALAVILDVIVARFEAPEIPLVFVHLVDVFAHQDAVLILRQKIVRGVGLAAKFGKHRRDVHVNVRMLIEKFSKPPKVVAVKGEMRGNEFRSRVHRKKMIAFRHQRFKRRIFD